MVTVSKIALISNVLRWSLEDVFLNVLYYVNYVTDSK